VFRSLALPAAEIHSRDGDGQELLPLLHYPSINETRAVLRTCEIFGGKCDVTGEFTRYLERRISTITCLSVRQSNRQTGVTALFVTAALPALCWACAALRVWAPGRQAGVGGRRRSERRELHSSDSSVDQDADNSADADADNDADVDQDSDQDQDADSGDGSGDGQSQDSDQDADVDQDADADTDQDASSSNTASVVA
jgi:hypothetical protein